MNIAQLQKMTVGERIGGGFVLTVKKTKKSVQLPNKYYIHTVVLFDSTGEMLADFKDQGGKGAYNPMIKGHDYKIIVAEIQHADPASKEIALRDAKKLYVDQFSKVTQGSEPDVGYAPGEDYPDWRTTVRGKIRHGLVCAFIQSGEIAVEPITKESKEYIEAMTEYIMTGE